MNNCDEFIFYDDLVAEKKPTRRRSRPKARSRTGGTASKEAAAEPATETGNGPAPPANDDPAQQAIDLVLEIAEAIYAERGDRAKLWGSMIKQTLKRRRPGFNEAFYGFGSFSDLLEEAQTRGFVELESDERSGGYVVRRISRD